MLTIIEVFDFYQSLIDSFKKSGYKLIFVDDEDYKTTDSILVKKDDEEQEVSIKMSPIKLELGEGRFIDECLLVEINYEKVEIFVPHGQKHFLAIESAKCLAEKDPSGFKIQKEESK